ncbi:hypothetical protein AB4212_15730 [Streptomyces sp. 2MCAF27]
MLRALAYDSDDPAGVMGRLDKVMQGLTSIELVTAVIARVETPATGPCDRGGCTGATPDTCRPCSPSRTAALACWRTGTPRPGSRPRP